MEVSQAACEEVKEGVREAQVQVAELVRRFEQTASTSTHALGKGTAVPTGPSADTNPAAQRSLITSLERQLDDARVRVRSLREECTAKQDDIARLRVQNKEQGRRNGELNVQLGEATKRANWLQRECEWYQRLVVRADVHAERMPNAPRSPTRELPPAGRGRTLLERITRAPGELIGSDPPPAPRTARPNRTVTARSAAPAKPDTRPATAKEQQEPAQMGAVKSIERKHQHVARADGREARDAPQTPTKRNEPVVDASTSGSTNETGAYPNTPPLSTTSSSFPASNDPELSPLRGWSNLPRQSTEIAPHGAPALKDIEQDREKAARADMWRLMSGRPVNDADGLEEGEILMPSE